MDINAIGKKIKHYFQKYRIAILILAIGIVLMLLPGKKKEESTPIPSSQSVQFEDPTRELAQILSQVRGAGKVQILLTKGTTERTVFQTDKQNDVTDQGQSIRVETIIVTDASRNQQGLVQQILAPQYRGAIVVCQGADDMAVRLAVIEAVADATGLGTDRISVLKMK